TGDVMIDGIRPTDLFARRLVAGNVIATGDGRVDVQFGDASAFALAPRSMLELRRFDADAIELVVEGTVDIDVAPRAARQTFIVRAGDRVVEVRGTRFRVQHDKTKTVVACRHGLVAVRAGSGHVEVGAARRVELAPHQAVASDRMRPLSFDEVNDLAQSTPMTLPMFDHISRSQASGWLDALLQSSAPLEIATVGRREVRVDGVELGMAPLRVRVAPGRHIVDVADAAGRYRRAGWVDVAVPTAATKPARLEVPAEPTAPTRTVNARKKQLATGADKSRLAHCVRSIAKSGLTGTYVQIEIAVDAQGAVSFLNILDTDLPSTTANCVRDVLTAVRFGPGDAATWRERIDL
ncbi:MAG TPA: FecR family protein, partial [Kofleriaceae bacterium]|nr:FecR family protein [Kofleriaceae bacterium]